MLSRRQLLWSGAGLCTLGALPRGIARASGTASRKRLIYVYAHGAWDPTYTFDPKLGNPDIHGPEDDPGPREPGEVESMETIHGHRVAVNEVQRPQVLRFFEDWGPQVLSIVGVTIGGIAHYPNRLRLLTGGTDRSKPDLVSILGHHTEVTEPFGAIDLSGWAFHGAYGTTTSRAGANWQLRTLLRPGEEGLGKNLATDPVEDHLVEEYLRRRAQARTVEAPLERWPVDLSDAIDRLEQLRQHRTELATLFDRAPGRADDNLDLAVDLIAGGWARSVLVDSQYYFDTHDNNSDQSGINDNLFGSLGRMLTRMRDLGILDDTLVVVSSEMTRSLQLNRTNGKDHWPLLATLLVGGGTVGGRRLGQTDDRQSPEPVNLVTGALDANGEIPAYNNLYAGILDHLGIDVEAHMPGVVPLGGIGSG